MSAPEAPCPHCGHTLTDLWDYAWSYDEDEERDIECVACEKPLVLKRRVHTTYEAVLPSREEP